VEYAARERRTVNHPGLLETPGDSGHTSDLFQYIAVFYNRSRRHSSLGYLSPTTFLQNWIERQGQQERAA
jgi:putative transposase